MGLLKNPFEVFGLTPEIADRLGEKDLHALIKAVYRVLLKIYHPDRGKVGGTGNNGCDTGPAVELNLAYEKLDLEKDPPAFRRRRTAYASRKSSGMQKKVRALRQELDGLQADKDALADGFMLYLLRGLPWLSDNGNEPVPSPLALTNLKLGLNDVAINQNVRSVSWDLGSNYKEIVFDALGSLYYRPVGRSRPFAANFIHLLGAIETSKIDLVPLLNRVPPKEGFFKSPALDSRYGIDGAPLQVLNTISMDKFKQHCLPLLRPEILERAYLFSIHRPIFEREESVSVEGVIVKISKL